MIGRVGDDRFGERLLATLRDDKIDCDAIQVTSDEPSGLAMIAVADSGENQIVVAAGANACLSTDDVNRFQDLILESDLLLMQLETPLNVVRHALRLAIKHDVRVILDPAPAPQKPLPDELYQADLLCPNETETLRLAGASGGHPSSLDDIERNGRAVQQRGAKNVAITLGEQGICLLQEDRVTHVPAFEVQAADTTAAGDAFAGALAVRWVETDDLPQSVRFGAAAGALAATRLGAQVSVPSRDQIERLLDARIG